jgi:hypothetical protein
MSEINWLIDWCLMPTLAVFRLYRGVEIYWLLLDILIFLLFLYEKFERYQSRTLKNEDNSMNTVWETTTRQMQV